MSYTVCLLTRWGSDGLESYQELVSYDDRELAWDFVAQYYRDHGTKDILSVRKPDVGVGKFGYPTPWDDDPDWVIATFNALVSERSSKP